MEFKDEGGDTVYGFVQSKKNADEIIKQQKRTNALLTWLIMVFSLFFFMSMYILYRIESGNIIANVVSRCVC